MLGQTADVSWTLILLGGAAGVISGALGVGSGILLVPALVFLYCFPQKSAQGISLAVMVPMALVGAIRYKLNPEITVATSAVALLAIGAVAGAFAGTEVARHLPGNVLRKCLAIFIIVVGVKMLWTTPKPAASANKTVTAAVSAAADQSSEEAANVRQ